MSTKVDEQLQEAVAATKLERKRIAELNLQIAVLETKNARLEAELEFYRDEDGGHAPISEQAYVDRVIKEVFETTATLGGDLFARVCKLLLNERMRLLGQARCHKIREEIAIERLERLSKDGNG